MVFTYKKDASEKIVVSEVITETRERQYSAAEIDAVIAELNAQLAHWQEVKAQVLALGCK